MKSAPVIMAYMVAIVYATTVRDRNVHNTEVAELKAKVTELNNKLVDSNAKLAESNKYIRGTQLVVAASPPESQNELRAKVEALDMRTCPDRSFSNKNCKSWGNAASTLAGGNFPTGSASGVLEAASHELTYGLQMLQQHTLGESKQGCSVSQAVSTLESTEKTIKIKMKVPRVAISAVKERVTGWSLQNKKYCGPFPGDDACKSTSTSDKCFPGGDFNNCKAQCKGGCKGVSYDSNRNWCILCKSVTSLNTHSSWKTATKGGQGKEVWAPGRAIGHPIGANALPDTFTGIFDDTLCNIDWGICIVNVWCLQWQRVIQKINAIFGSGRAQVSEKFMDRKCRVDKGRRNPINLNDAALSKVDKNTVVSGNGPNGQSVALTQSSESGCIPVCSDITVADHVKNSKSKVYAGFGSPDSRHSKGGVLCYKACEITLPSQTVQIIDRTQFDSLKDFLRDHKALTPDIEKNCDLKIWYPDFVYEATFVAVKEVRCINPLSHSSKTRQPILNAGKSLSDRVYGMDTRDNWSVRNECGRMGHSSVGEGACPKDCKVPQGAPIWFRGCVGGSEFRELLQKQIRHGSSLICKVYKSCNLKEAKLTHLKSRPNCPTCKQYALKAGHTINVPTILANGHQPGCANF